MKSNIGLVGREPEMRKEGSRKGLVCHPLKVASRWDPMVRKRLELLLKMLMKVEMKVSNYQAANW